MKTAFYILLFILISCSYSFSQSGNVGVGTSSPDQQLHVVSEDSTGYAGAIKLEVPNMLPTSDAVIMFGKNTDTANQAEIRFNYEGPSSINNRYEFGFSNIQPFVFFNRLGRVGIGEDEPDAKLHVKDGGIKIEDGTEGAGKVLTSDADGLASWQSLAAEVDPQVSSATTNSVPKWDGTSLVDGLITDDGTEVVIATDAKVNLVTVGLGPGNVTSNTVVGNGALANNTTGGNNTAIGRQALFTSSTSGLQTAVGSFSLHKNTTGFGNTATGAGSLFENTTGVFNVAAGLDAMNDNTEGSRNTALGTYAMRRNTTGENNVAIGDQAMDAFTTGSNNVVIGARADLESDGLSNAIAIGYNSRVGASNSIVLGSTNVNVAIGTTIPEAKLHVEGGKIKMVDGTEGAGKVLTSDADGLASWQSLAAEVDPQVSSATTNRVPKWDGTALVDGLIFDDGTEVSIINDAKVNEVNMGIGAGNVTSNTVFGRNALESNVSGFSNTAIGRQTLANNTTSQQTAVGAFALSSVTTGQANTAVGETALRFNTVGIFNTATGVGALNNNVSGSRNTAAGLGAMQLNSTGNENAAYGSEALLSNISGSQNTAIGFRSGRNASGSGNVFIGYRAGFSETGNNTLYIDNSDTSDPLIYGDFATDKLYIHGTINISETAKLAPLSTAPACAAGDEGLLYFDDGLKKLRVCDGTTWQNLH